MATALVTGATSGIGRGFARRLASDGYDMALVARDSGRLAELGAELEADGVRCEVLAADVGDRDQLAAVEARLSDADRPVDVLVNSAGFGLGQRFIGGDVQLQQAAVDVMVTAVMRLTHAAVPGMVARGHGSVINVASVAAFLPFSPYSAAKSWVVVFTEGLATELEGSGVRALALCPGFVRTEFHDRAGIEMSRSSDTWWLEVDDVVRDAMEALRRGKTVTVSGGAYKAMVAGTHLLPRNLLRRAERFRRSAIVERL
jgi:short-subunit dehydrogenase